MANIVYMAKSAWTGLLDTIRSKASVSGTMTVSQATTAVENIPTGGGGDFGSLADKTITEASGNASLIGYYAFYHCSLLTRAYFPNATIVSAYAFYSCKSLNNLTISSGVTSIGDYGFYLCKSLTTDPDLFSNVTSLGVSAFTGCSSLSIASFPKLSQIPTNAFNDDVNLTTAIFPRATSVGGSAFQYCSRLTTTSFPKLRIIGTSAFSGCFRLETISLPSASNISGSAFYRCLNLKSLYLLGPSFCRLSGLGAFTSTPISDYTTSTGGVHGSIFVPASLYDQYISASNWSVYSDRFVSVAE